MIVNIEGKSILTATMEERIWHRNYDPWVSKALNYPGIPVSKLLENTAEKYPKRDALIFIGERITYSKLLKLSNQFAHSLTDLGVKKGDRVALYLPNTPHIVIAYYGTLKAGAIVVNTNPLYTERELRYQLEDSGANTIVTLNLKRTLLNIISVIDKIRLKNIIIGSVDDFLPFPKNLIYSIIKRTEIGAIPSKGGYYRFTELIKRRSQSPEVNVDPEDIAVLQYTGGTTGISKGAALSHKNLLVNAYQVRSWIGEEGILDGKERILTVLPCFHVYAMTVCMNIGVMVGATLILLPRFNPDEVLRVVKKYRPTIFPGVPTIYTAIANHPDVKRYGMDSVKLCLSGGAPLPSTAASRVF
ncbi:MAG: long-chain fatty acid--CoA ligase, partial [Candidatus Dadabacteria bacterium]